MMREKTPVLDVPFGIVFAAFILFLISIGLSYVGKLFVLFGPNWKAEVGVIEHDLHNSESVE